MASPDRSSLPVAALVAQLASRVGEPDKRFLAVYRFGGLRVSCPPRAFEITMFDAAGSWIGCNDSDFDENPGIRNALVGAVLAWILNNAHYPQIGSYPVEGGNNGCRVYYYSGDTREGPLVISGNTKIVEDPDPLRALLLAALAVKDRMEGNR